MAKTRWRAQLEYSTIVACRSLRSEEATRKGTEHSPGTYQMLADVHALVCMQDFGLDGVDYMQPGRIRPLLNADMQNQSLSVFAQNWTAVVDTRLREPGQSSIDDTQTGYLPPDGTPFPGETNINNPTPLQPLQYAHLRYWLKPPRNIALDPSDAEDRIPLNVYL